jgi:CheY-like chemotaxis protein
MPGPQILVVDDTPDVLEITSAILEEEGYAIVRANDGSEAVEILRDGHAIDLMLTDIVMPGELHGFELARRAKALRPDIKIAYITGYSSLIPDGIGDIFGPILRKPIRANELVDQIRLLLRPPARVHP